MKGENQRKAKTHHQFLEGKCTSTVKYIKREFSAVEDENSICILQSISTGEELLSKLLVVRTDLLLYVRTDRRPLRGIPAGRAKPTLE